MLLISAILITILALIHSYLGEKNLIRPLLHMEGLPVILGSLKNTKVTLWVVWHMTTAFMLAIAVIMMRMHLASSPINIFFLWSVSALFAIFGLAAIILSKGAHKSWIIFFPVSLMSATTAVLS